MTTIELIRLLEQMPADMEVVHSVGEDPLANLRVVSVEVAPTYMWNDDRTKMGRRKAVRLS